MGEDRGRICLHNTRRPSSHGPILISQYYETRGCNVDVKDQNRIHRLVLVVCYLAIVCMAMVGLSGADATLARGGRLKLLISSTRGDPSLETLMPSLRDWNKPTRLHREIARFCGGCHGRIGSSLRGFLKGQEGKARLASSGGASLCPRGNRSQSEECERVLLACSFDCAGRTDKGDFAKSCLGKPTKDALDKGLDIDPKHASCHYLMAELYLQLPGPPLSIGNKQKAVEEAKLAVKYDPSESCHHLVLGRALIATKQYDEARAVLNRLIAMRPIREIRRDFGRIRMRPVQN